MPYLNNFISDLSSFIPVAAGFYFYKRLKKDRLILLYLLLYALWVEMSNAWLASHHYYNLWQVHIYTLVELTCLLIVFNMWVKQVTLRWLCLTGGVAFYLLWAFVFLQQKDMNVSNLPADVTENVLLLLASGFVVTTISLQTEKPLFRNYKFIFGAAVFIYFGVNTFLSYLFALLINSPQLLNEDIWIIHSVVNTAVNIIYAYGFTIKEMD